MKIRSLIVIGALAGLVPLTACSRSPEPGSSSAPTSVPAAPALTAAQGSSSDITAGIGVRSDSSDSSNADITSGVLPKLVVHKSPSCGCCTSWVTHMRESGFQVEVRNVHDLSQIKERMGVPRDKASCHTAEVDGYFVEGHVPAKDVLRLLAERPDARGIAVAGMPLGSPGMEMPDGRVESYTVDLVALDGASSDYARYGH